MSLSSIKANISRFLSTPRKMFWFYIVLNMIPSILLTITEPFNFMGKVVLIVFPLGVYMVIYSLFKNNGKLQIILFPLLFLHAFQIVLFYLFGEDVIAADMFLNVVTTNASEISELLGSILPSVILVCVLYIPTTIFAARQWKKRLYLDKPFRRKMIVPGFIIVGVSIIISFFGKDINTDTFTFKQDVYPINIFYNLGFATNKWNNNSNYFETSKDFSYEAHRDSICDKREIYVMVIGETGRADNWSLYGYERETNPRLSKKEGLVVFQDALTQSNTTHKSVSIMLSDASAENYNIIYQRKGILTAFKEAGFKTAFLSNQARNHTFTDFFSSEADVFKTIREAGAGVGLTPNPFDGELIPLMKNVIDSIPDNLFIILHTYGSHFNYCDRYPTEFSKFKPDNVTEIKKSQKDRLINAYDNTILYTDNFLASLTETLKETEACSALFYSSDHGEDILDDSRGRFLHASPSPTYYQLKIAMMMWFSPVYRELFPDNFNAAIENKNKAITTNSIFHTLLDMSHVKTKYLQRDLSLLNPHFENRTRMYLSDHDKPIPYYKMNLKKQDFEMLDKNGVHR